MRFHFDQGSFFHSLFLILDLFHSIKHSHFHYHIIFIVLTHYPDYIDTIANYNVDLVLAGHSLLGQIRIPFFGGVIKKDNATKYLDSYYMVNNTKIFVSAGLGTDNNFKFRLFNKPTINLYRLNKES